MGGIFINYRGEDSQTTAALIDQHLTARFGSDLVFLDSRSIPAGTDFTEELLERVQACSVLLVVIGPHWLTLTNEAGQRRIDDPRDWLHQEIAQALRHGLRIIPILLDGARLPAETELPDDLTGLSRRQYVPLRRRHTKSDLADLAERITQTDPELAKVAARRQANEKQPPRQLPAEVAYFAGRSGELAALTGLLRDRADTGGTVVISAIGGTAGVGKTALALHWAHQNIDRFPDGQLHVDLRGFDPSGEPMSSAVAVRGFLDALGVKPATIPIDLSAQAALYRSLVSGKRMLVVLDNASSSEQAKLLLPGSPTCTVLVTSRRRLSGLVTRHGARPLDLDVLTQADARELFTRHVGVDRVDAEPEAATELLEWCAGLPLAISIVAARAAQHPEFPLAMLAEELREEPLDAMEGGELAASLRAVFSWSYYALESEQAEVFRLLGLAPGPDISAPAAASLTALSIPRVRVVLGSLEDASLVQQLVPGRWRMHDLIRIYAARRSSLTRPCPAATPTPWTTRLRRGRGRTPNTSACWPPSG